MWWQNFYPNVWVMGRGVFRFVTKRIHEPLQFFLINKAQLKSKNHLFSRLVKHWNKFLLCNYAACQSKLCLKNRVKRIKTTAMVYLLLHWQGTRPWGQNTGKFCFCFCHHLSYTWVYLIFLISQIFPKFLWWTAWASWATILNSIIFLS